MSDLKSLAHRLMSLEDKLTACMRCGNCQAVCPMFATTHMEADVARGKIVLIENLAHEVIRDPKAVYEKLSRCLLCGQCQAGCPSGVQNMNIYLQAREIVCEYLGLSVVKKMIFRVLLAQPKLFNFSMRIGAPASRLLFYGTKNVQKTTCSPMLKFMIGDRHIRRLPTTPLHAEVGFLDEPRINGGLRVAFFPGCMGDKFYVDMAKACLKVFKHHGVAVYMPDSFACCGIPSISSGDAAGMVAELKKNLPLLDNDSYDYLVTPCGSCTETIKTFWPQYAARINPAAVESCKRIAAKTVDINAFIVNVLKVQAVPTSDRAVTVTFHDSCHLKKGLGVFKEPRTLIGANSRYRLVEMKDADKCCGCGGSFTLYHYDLSQLIGERKRANVVASGAQVVSSGCPACMMQLEDVLSHHKDNVIVKHPVEIYAETL